MLIFINWLLLYNILGFLLVLLIQESARFLGNFTICFCFLICLLFLTKRIKPSLTIVFVAYPLLFMNLRLFKILGIYNSESFLSVFLGMLVITYVSLIPFTGYINKVLLSSGFVRWSIDVSLGVETWFLQKPFLERQLLSFFFCIIFFWWLIFSTNLSYLLGLPFYFSFFCWVRLRYFLLNPMLDYNLIGEEIGRASCRERV